VKQVVSPGSETCQTPASENISKILTVVIDRATGKIKRVYGHDHDEPCDLCDEKATCNKTGWKECEIYCG
jgi:hypothetical protein